MALSAKSYKREQRNQTWRGVQLPLCSLQSQLAKRQVILTFAELKMPDASVTLHDNRWLYKGRASVGEKAETLDLHQLPFLKGSWAKQGNQPAGKSRRVQPSNQLVLFRHPQGQRAVGRINRNLKLQTVQMRPLGLSYM